MFKKQQDVHRNMGLYAIYDSRAQDFGPVFMAVNDQVAQRQFSMMKIEPQFRDEFEVFYLGSYNSETGIIVPNSPRKVVEIEKLEEVTRDEKS